MTKNKHFTSQQKGFTLIELMVTVAIIGIVAAMAAPSYTTLIQKNEVGKVGRQFMSTLNLARNTAYVSGRSVTVCPVADIDAATVTCLGTWGALNQSATGSRRGWIAYSDYATTDSAGVSTPQTKVYEAVAFNNLNVTIDWSRGTTGITLRTKGVTTLSGTFRVISTERGSLPAWDSSNPPTINKYIFENRVSLSSLGKVTYRN